MLTEEQRQRVNTHLTNAIEIATRARAKSAVRDGTLMRLAILEQRWAAAALLSLDRLRNLDPRGENKGIVGGDPILSAWLRLRLRKDDPTGVDALMYLTSVVGDSGKVFRDKLDVMLGSLEDLCELLIDVWPALAYLATMVDNMQFDVDIGIAGKQGPIGQTVERSILEGLIRGDIQIAVSFINTLWNEMPEEKVKGKNDPAWFMLCSLCHQAREIARTMANAHISDSIANFDYFAKGA